MCPPAARALHSSRDEFTGILPLLPDGLLLLLLPTIFKNEVTTLLGCNGCIFFCPELSDTARLQSQPLLKPLELCKQMLCLPL